MYMTIAPSDTTASTAMGSRLFIFGISVIAIWDTSPIVINSQTLRCPTRIKRFVFAICFSFIILYCPPFSLTYSFIKIIIKSGYFCNNKFNASFSCYFDLKQFSLFFLLYHIPFIWYSKREISIENKHENKQQDG